MSYEDASEYDRKLRNGRRTFLELGIFCLITIIGVGLYLYSQQLPFTSPKWKAAAKLTNGTKQRGRMLSDLLRRHEIVGLSRAQVLELLGKPDNPESETATKDFHYNIDLPGDSMTSTVDMIVTFDQQDKVSKCFTKTFESN